MDLEKQVTKGPNMPGSYQLANKAIQIQVLIDEQNEIYKLIPYVGKIQKCTILDIERTSIKEPLIPIFISQEKKIIFVKDQFFTAIENLPNIEVIKPTPKKPKKQPKGIAYCHKTNDIVLKLLSLGNLATFEELFDEIPYEERPKYIIQLDKLGIKSILRREI